MKLLNHRFFLRCFSSYKLLFAENVLGHLLMVLLFLLPTTGVYAVGASGEAILTDSLVSFPSDAEIYVSAENVVRMLATETIDSCVGEFRSCLDLGNPDVSVEAWRRAVAQGGHGIASTFLDDIFFDDKVIVSVFMEYVPQSRHLLEVIQESASTEVGEEGDESPYMAKYYVYEVTEVLIVVEITFVFNFETAKIVKSYQSEGSFKTSIDFDAPSFGSTDEKTGQ